MPFPMNMSATCVTFACLVPHVTCTRGAVLSQAHVIRGERITPVICSYHMVQWTSESVRHRGAAVSRRVRAPFQRHRLVRIFETRHMPAPPVCKPPIGGPVSNCGLAEMFLEVIFI